ncbi:MAG: DUF4157 domain-containing protein [Chromatiales bacterium]|jgi:hypothetical protein
MYTKTQQAKTEAGKESERSRTSSTPHFSYPVLKLQRKYGNQIVQRLLQTGAIQAKLRIGQPDDKYEQEADRFADQVMHMPGPSVTDQSHSNFSNQTPVIPLKCTECNEQVNRELSSGDKEEQVSAPSIVHDVLQSPGHSLDSMTRAFMEPRFGHDFSQVRVHTDTKAAKSAQAVNALAYTVGQDVVFGAGQFSPGTASGLRLLAHELTHVIQQSRGEVRRTPAETVTPDQVTVTNNGTGVTADAIQVLQEIVASIGETSATITSGRRTPAEQAAAMYTNLENTSVEAQKELYGSSGDKVIDVYVAGKAATPAKDAATIKQEMTDKINELGPSNVSRHCSENSVIDVAPSSITDDEQFQTKAEAHARVTKYLGPATTPSDPAHHLEIT